MASQSIQFPDDFKCPISLELMTDPVILSSGHTFDRSSIQRWLDAGHRTCPVSKLPLSDPPLLIPNHALRSLILNYTLISFPSPLSSGNPDELTKILLSPSSSSALKGSSFDQLVKLCKRDSCTRWRLIESGAVSAVVNCVSSDDSSLQENALRLLLNLSLDDDSKVGLVAEGVVEKVVGSIRFGAGDSRALAATVLTSLAMVEVNKVTIGAFPDAISGLIGLLAGGNGRERKEAATALFTLCSFADNRIRAVDNRAVPILIQNLGLGLERAVEVLGLLAKCKKGREEMLENDGFLEILISLLGNGSSRGIQYGLFTINLLCNYSEKMCFEALNKGVFEICVGLLEDDNEKVRKNANNLIEVLQAKRGNLF